MLWTCIRSSSCPCLRGIGTLVQAMSLGMKALKFSADVSMEEIQKEEQAKNPKAKDMPGWIMAANLIFSLVMFIGMYKFLPLLAVTWLKGYYPVLNGRIPFNLADGVIRMLIFLVFMYALSLMKDIHRVFRVPRRWSIRWSSTSNPACRSLCPTRRSS